MRDDNYEEFATENAIMDNDEFPKEWKKRICPSSMKRANFKEAKFMRICIVMLICLHLSSIITSSMFYKIGALYKFLLVVVELLFIYLLYWNFMYIRPFTNYLYLGFVVVYLLTCAINITSLVHTDCVASMIVFPI